MVENTLFRIKQYITNKGLSVSAFEKSINASNGSLASQIKNQKTIGSDKLENILKVYSEINPDWLLTGNGEMLKKSETKILTKNEISTKNSDSSIAKPVENPTEGIPLIPIEAMAGYGGGEMQVMEFESERFVVPTFKGADFLIQVKGSSMYPKYNSGDIVACKKLQSMDVFFQWNKVYVLDTEQGALIKRIDPGKDEDHVLIVSDNAKYQPFNLPKYKINAISIVMGVIRLE